MKHYPQERRDAILKKMAPPQSLSVAELSRQEGIPSATLYNWRKQARERGQVLPSRSSAPEEWSSEEKFHVVLETAPMSKAEFSAYCRKRGLYPEQVEAWKQVCLGANGNTAQQDREAQQSKKAEQARMRQLEKELRRKEKALAETAALLTLSKKAEAIWGSNNEDD